MGSRITSSERPLLFIFQTDRNVVLYKRRKTVAKPRWHTNTRQATPPAARSCKPDGNFALAKTPGPSGHRAPMVNQERHPRGTIKTMKPGDLLPQRNGARASKTVQPAEPGSSPLTCCATRSSGSAVSCVAQIGPSTREIRISLQWSSLL